MGMVRLEKEIIIIFPRHYQKKNRRVLGSSFFLAKYGAIDTANHTDVPVVSTSRSIPTPFGAVLYVRAVLGASGTER